MGNISVRGVGKAYRKYPTRVSRLIEWLLPKGHIKHQLKWVIRNLNFEIKAGESVGVIGINGAGKSTLLKMITGTTSPTEGQVEVRGRLAALLELGMGFHPDFTGRQNAYMACQLLGYQADEISQLMPDIESFAEIGEYIDLPVRVYSSGMQMRLAFSVATAKRPDILIVDEALSVGDVYFQHKSFERIRNYRRLGTTLILVSHDKQAIQSICDRAFLLDSGRLVKEGKPEEIMDYYNAMIAQRENSTIQQKVLDGGSVQTVSGNGRAVILSRRLLNASGQIIEVVKVGERIKLQVQLQAQENLQEVVLGYMIKDRLGQTVFGTNTAYLGKTARQISQGQKMKFEFEFEANLGEGSYSITIAAHSSVSHIAENYVWQDRASLFTVINSDRPHFSGVAWIHPECEVIFEGH